MVIACVESGRQRQTVSQSPKNVLLALLKIDVCNAITKRNFPNEDVLITWNFSCLVEQPGLLEQRQSQVSHVCCTISIELEGNVPTGDLGLSSQLHWLIVLSCQLISRPFFGWKTSHFQLRTNTSYSVDQWLGQCTQRKHFW